MKTWRERIVAARERGRFTDEDREAWTHPRCCYVGEMRERYGLNFNLEMTKIDDDASACGPLQKAIQHAINRDEVDAAERLLDQVEDLALQLKREATS